MAPSVSIVWFQKDLRLDDNRALYAASQRGAVLPVFVWSPETEGEWPSGAASRWWLHHSVIELSKNLVACGSRLVIARGEPSTTLIDLAKETHATAVFWNQRYEPDCRDLQNRVANDVRAAGIQAEGFHGSVLFGPDEVRTGQGGPFKVFTPFWKACLSLPSPLGPLPPPRTLAPPSVWPHSIEPRELRLLPQKDWAGGIEETWRPGENGALETLEKFLSGPVSTYAVDRNRPDMSGTSRLSPYLHFGEISPRRVWHEATRLVRRDGRKDASTGAESFLRELGWREFAHHLLCHFPHTAREPLRPEFSLLQWRDDPAGLDAWRKGRTGYPMVDAGMRELWATGWMHNRVRMIAASFLVKDLLVHWMEGARWFWDTLVDADLANNTLGWQWTAGCGADAAPFFRIFNPTIQGKKFDPDGKYVRRWVPEIRELPTRWIHKPWEAPADALEKAGVRLGKTYPLPIVDHFAARDRALDALAAIQKKGATR